MKTLLLSRLVGVILLTAACIQTADAQVPDRSKPPAVGPPPSLTLPDIRQLKLSNGLPVVLMEKRTVPVVQITLVIKAGMVNEPAGKTGLAGLTASMLTEGAGRRDALQLADAVDYLGARLSASAGLHTSAVSLFAPVSKLDSALALMGDVVLKPTFPGAELDRKRRDRLTTLLQWRDQPSALASVIYNRTLYPAHPYGRPAIGDEASIRAVTDGDLRAFHDTYYRPNNATLIVVGDVSEREILQKLERTFTPWTRGKIPAATLPPVGQVASREIILVDRPGSAQTEIRIGRVGAERLTEDYYALVVMNTILGGSFTSRLNANLREEHGYTYGARSSFSFRAQPGPFTAGAGVQTAVTDSALHEFMKELRGMLDRVSDDDVAKAKNYVALSYPGDFQTVSQTAGQLEEMVVYALPPTYFNSYIANILAVTRGDVLRVAEKYLVPDRLLIVLVGDRAKIENGVKALNLGPIRTMTIEEVLGPAPDPGVSK